MEPLDPTTGMPDPTTVMIVSALIAADVDPDAISSTPDGVVTVTRPTGSRWAVGPGQTDEDGVDWWEGTRYGAEDDIEAHDSWTSLEAMVAAVAEWAAR